MQGEISEQQRRYREEYLQSGHWKAVREGALRRAAYRCQVCNSDKSLDVHHRTYERVGRELPEDLTVLCRKCHNVFHNSGRRTHQAPKQTKPKGPARAPEFKALTRENDRLRAIQERNRAAQAAAREARKPRVVIDRPSSS